ncbi:hypothetical protein GCM10022254_06080 [Actinomadura meridiana]|uniref:Uncharacterized protein n=1 Tax=Actinomadura meridiana TaxID=559626 RepID=A0ABP8BSS8_9ACTN
MAIYDLYGTRVESLDQLLGPLSVVLGITWEERESDYRGVYHRASAVAYGGKDLVLQSNRLTDEDGDYFQVPEYPDYGLLLFVNRCTGADEVRDRLAAGLPEWAFLRRKIID